MQLVNNVAPTLNTPACVPGDIEQDDKQPVCIKDPATSTSATINMAVAEVTEVADGARTDKEKLASHAAANTDKSTTDKQKAEVTSDQSKLTAAEGGSQNAKPAKQLTLAVEDTVPNGNTSAAGNGREPRLKSVELEQNSKHTSGGGVSGVCFEKHCDGNSNRTNSASKHELNSSSSVTCKNSCSNTSSNTSNTSNTSNSGERNSVGATREEKQQVEKQVEDSEEAAAMKELLNRSDTAIIYPEPVSDHEEKTEETHEESLAMTIDTNQPVIGNPAALTGGPGVQGNPNQKLIINKNACVKCGATFVLKSQLDKHLLLHSPTSQVCSVCRKTFANVYRLQRHMISHDESTDLRKFKCAECGKAFKFKHHLKEHVRIHSGEKPFECANCGKRFSHSGSYSSHMTSKKCWVMNVKMAAAAASGGVTADNNKRSYAASVGAEKSNDMDVMPSAAELTLNTLYATQLQQHQAVAAAASAFLHYEAAGSAGNVSHVQQTIPYLQSLGAAQARGFLPFSTAAQLGHMLSAQLAAGGTYAHLPTTLAYPEGKTDENQNEKQKQARREKNEGKAEEAKCKLSCQFCGETFHNAVDQHQHERYLCELREERGYSSSSTPRASEDKDGAAERLASGAASGNGSSSSSGLTCKHCGTTFNSPVDLHQHERYLCKANTEIHVVNNVEANVNSIKSAMATPVTVSKFNSKAPGSGQSKHPSTQQQGTSSAASEDDPDDQFVDKDGQQYRVRSMITDQQLAVLKAKYAENPRPASHELMEIGTQIGFPKRVVQVWFQNMRARDRRRGKVIGGGPNVKMSRTLSSSPTSAASAVTKTEGASVSDTAVASIAPEHFAGIPQLNNAQTVPNAPYYATVNTIPTGSLYASSLNTSSASSDLQDEPLDLSMKSKKLPPLSPAPATIVIQPVKSLEQDSEVLNLSLKNASASPTPVPRDATSSPATQSSVEASAKEEIESDAEIKIELKPAPLSPITCVTNGSPGEGGRGPRYASTPGASSPPPAMSSPTASDVAGASDAAGGTTSLESSFNSGLSLDSAGMEVHHHGAGSLLALAKRPRKLEADDYCSGDSLTIDECAAVASPSSDSSSSAGGGRKRARKSLKQHRFIDPSLTPSSSSGGSGGCAGEGSPQPAMSPSSGDGQTGPYACDQCDKLFSKQSSLARHKYEHSGQRPFACDTCRKSFKHKHHLTEHKRLHSGEKPFCCKKCGKRFSHSGSFSQHMNHRYKYCKPMKVGQHPAAPAADDMEI